MYQRNLVYTTKVGRRLTIPKSSCAYGSYLTIPNSSQCLISLLNLSVGMHSTIDASGTHLIPISTLMHVQSIGRSTHFLTSTISTTIVDDGVHTWDFDTTNWCVQVPWGLLKSLLMLTQALEFNISNLQIQKKVIPNAHSSHFYGV